MNFDDLKEQIMHPEDETMYFDPSDIESSKAVVIISCVLGWWFFLPLIAANTPYGKFYANQLLIVVAYDIVVLVLTGILGLIPILGALVRIVISFVSLAIYLFLLISACQGKARRIPIIGRLFEAFK